MEQPIAYGGHCRQVVFQHKRSLSLRQVSLYSGTSIFGPMVLLILLVL